MSCGESGDGSVFVAVLQEEQRRAEAAKRAREEAEIREHRKKLKFEVRDMMCGSWYCQSQALRLHRRLPFLSSQHQQLVAEL